MKITMKCENCNSEWSVEENISLTITVCPFCGEKIFDENKKSSIEDFDISSRGILKSYLGNDTDIVIPSNVNRIKYEAFKNESICSITIPKSVISIDVGAFNCGECIDIYYEGTIEQWMKIEHPGWLESKTKFELYIEGKKITDVIIDSKMIIRDYAFLNCKSLKRVKVLECLENIPHAMFYGCIGLTDVELIDGISSIENATFYGCISLEKIKIPESVTSIGASAFGLCKKLKDINIPYSVRSIGIRAFMECNSLTNIIIPDNVRVIEGEVFSGCTNLREVKLSENITSIEDNLFRNCTSLREIVIPANVSAIGLAAFWECSLLKTIKFKKPTNWYNVGYIIDNWRSKNGGTPIDMSDSTKNVETLVKRHRDCRFYKK